MMLKYIDFILINYNYNLLKYILIFYIFLQNYVYITNFFYQFIFNFNGLKL